LIAAHDRTLSQDGGSMWFMLAIGYGLWETGRAISGLWRILDGKNESGLMSDSELRGGGPHLC
jgi:hypothetical protein